jgi:ubiquinone/menaquinone biosynthesis C-methylase UbiE
MKTEIAVPGAGTLINSYNIKKDHIRKNLNKYTRKSYKLIPEIKNPNILDIGCGTGVPTIELAQISGGGVTGVDNDSLSLEILQNKINTLELNNQVRFIKDSINTMDFPEKSFDIIWAEGSVFVMGFENSIKEWYRFLKPQGFLVIHDDVKEKNKKLELVKKYGYKLIAELDLSNQIWEEEYFIPLEQLINEFKEKYPDDLELSGELNKDQMEIDQARLNPQRVSSFIVILQKF